MLQILELIGSLFRLIWIGAAIASFYFLYGALAHDAPWSALLWSIGIGFIAKYLSVALNRTKQRWAYVNQLIVRGYTREQAIDAWRTAVNGGSNLLLNLQQTERIAGNNSPNNEKSKGNAEESESAH